jgi:fluoride ion exporter CrcB/FEX
MLWKRVNEASPHLLDEHLLTFTLRPSCCVLTAQKGPKYRDTLIMGIPGAGITFSGMRSEYLRLLVHDEWMNLFDKQLTHILYYG